MTRHPRAAAPALAAALALAAVPAHALTVYEADFDGPATVAAGVTAALSGGADTASVAPFNGTYGTFRRSADSFELTLSNLPMHTGVSLGFVMAFLDSWDSRDGGCCAPDNLDLSIDGTALASYTYNNSQGSVKDYGGGKLLHEYVQFDGNAYWTDTVVDMAGDPALSFAHSASTLTLRWAGSGAGWQGGLDEAFGIDDLTVSLVGVVPEPGTYALMLAGLAGVGLAARRRRR